MITALDHIAIAVPDLEKAVARFLEDFGLKYEGQEDVEAAKTSTAFFPLPETSIELVHPLRGEGPIAKYLEKKGGGLHHLCFRSDDNDADMIGTSPWESGPIDLTAGTVYTIDVTTTGAAIQSFFHTWEYRPVPSPSALALLGLGGLVAAGRRR